MTYTTDEIETFRTRWESYINDFERLKLAAPADDMADVSEAQDLLRRVVERAAESFEADHE